MRLYKCMRNGNLVLKQLCTRFNTHNKYGIIVCSQLLIPTCTIHSVSKFPRNYSTSRLVFMDKPPRNRKGSKKSNGDNVFSCPKCGGKCIVIHELSIKSQFIRCVTCHSLFVSTVQSDSSNDHFLSNKSKISDHFNTKDYSSLSDGKYVINDPKKESTPEKIFELPPPKNIFKYLNKHVIGQEYAKKVLSVAIYNHYKRLNYKSNSLNIGDVVQKANSDRNIHLDDLLSSNYRKYVTDHPVKKLSATPTFIIQNDQYSLKRDSKSKEIDSIDKSNILLMGSTGSRKTLLAKILAKYLQVPFAICDCTSLTQAGYVGEDIESVVGKLLSSADYDVNMAEKGIIFLDEVDKIGSVPGFQQTRDVGGEGVQQGMLKILEGTKVSVPERSSNRKHKSESIVVDTTNVLFVASGAFNGLDNIIQRRKNIKKFGFNDSKLEKESDTLKILNDYNKLLKHVEPSDVMEFGMIPEFVGRFPILAPVHLLNIDMLVKILVEPENSLINQYKSLFKFDNIKLEITQKALESIADKSLKRKTGARGLRGILEEILLEPMFECPGSNIESILVDKDSKEISIKYNYYKGFEKSNLINNCD
ncbi:hypothetical protein A3Q56_06439 [Intoshia linei]|uniref:ATP-dependent Clp protease ATP-binding subunit clpX-like, mitochondrial n=1 Tax=Intoshia linei TaxID=1819745 RepID=A0A177AV46_9BILA|nr:hypothetical protein A3Q56_06439 [Intoshia linei]